MTIICVVTTHKTHAQVMARHVRVQVHSIESRKTRMQSYNQSLILQIFLQTLPKHTTISPLERAQHSILFLAIPPEELASKPPLSTDALKEVFFSVFLISAPSKDSVAEEDSADAPDSLLLEQSDLCESAIRTKK